MQSLITDFFSRILPILALLFLCSFLDRTNVGNAKTYGLETGLKMTDHQYDIGLAAYYATYIARYAYLTYSPNTECLFHLAVSVTLARKLD